MPTAAAAVRHSSSCSIAMRKAKRKAKRNRTSRLIYNPLHRRLVAGDLSCQGLWQLVVRVEPCDGA